MNFHGNSTYSHAYIIRGGSEPERFDYAQTLAQAIICSSTTAVEKPCMSCLQCEKALRHIHPDIITIDRNPDTRVIYVDQIRALTEDAFIMPNDAEKKVYIIQHASSMNVNAQNAILKLLEEPPPSANFILLAENPAELLPTVRSRCVERSTERFVERSTERFVERSAERFVGTQGAQTRDDVAAFYQALTGSPLKLAGFSFALEKLEKTEFIDFIDGAKALIASHLEDALRGKKSGLTPEYLMNVLRVLDSAKEYLEVNVSLGHIAGMICAELIRNEETND
jgi:DNA polymerase III subunit delta'